MRFYQIDSGRILLDGTGHRADPRLGAGLLRDGGAARHLAVRGPIAYGQDGAADREIVTAARAVYADHFVRTLPGSYRPCARRTHPTSPPGNAGC
jgi:ATP-binding cassette, subfamily B, multidrug efflux pump